MYPATYPPTREPTKMHSLVTGRAGAGIPQLAIVYGAPAAGTRRANGSSGVEPNEPHHPVNERRPVSAGPGPLRASACALALACGLGDGPPAPAASDGEITAISSQVSPGYSRVKLPDGTFQPETYTFGEGGRLAGSSRDETIEKLTFLDVAGVIAGPLKKKNYIPVDDRNPEKTKLL